MDKVIEIESLLGLGVGGLDTKVVPSEHHKDMPAAVSYRAAIRSCSGYTFGFASTEVSKRARLRATCEGRLRGRFSDLCMCLPLPKLNHQTEPAMGSRDYLRASTGCHWQIWLRFRPPEFPTQNECPTSRFARTLACVPASHSVRPCVRPHPLRRR